MSAGERTARRLKTILDVATSLCLCAASTAIVASLWFGAFSTQAGTVAGTNSDETAVENVESQNFNLPVKGTQGEAAAASATVAIVEFSDFQCPYCGLHVRDTLPQLWAEYTKTGRVRYDVRYFPLEEMHPLAFPAAKAAACADEQGRFWEMYNGLFRAGRLADGQFVASAAEVGLDMAGFTKCLQRPGVDQAIRHDMSEGRRLGIKSTPTFLLGSVSKDGTIAVQRRIVGALSFDKIKATLDALLVAGRGRV